MANETEQQTDLAPTTTAPTEIMSSDESYANLLDPARFAQIWKVASAFSRSQLIPSHFHNKTEDCFVATHMAMRLQCDPVFFMQKSYVVHGKPGIEAQLAIALVNTSGLFKDPLEYEVVGDDPSEPGYKVRASAVRKSTGKTLYGPWITWDLVKAEKWLDKTGSKWKTMPALMFMYRAGTYFGRTYCPERLMGMQTVDELVDIDTSSKKAIPSREVTGKVAELMDGGQPDQPEPTTEVVDTDTGEVEQEENPTPAKPAETTAAQETTPNGANEDIVEGIDTEKLYFCPDCDISFDKPIIGKNKKTQCPKCLTTKIETAE